MELERTDHLACVRCGARLRSGGPLEGRCVACVWREISDAGASSNAVSSTFPSEHASPPIPRDAGPLPPGSVIGEYRTVGLLGEGGLGRVYRAVDTLGRAFAIKVAKPITGRRTSQLALQQNELEALRRLRHPALVACEGGGLLHDAQLYVVMELVEGTSLEELLAVRPALDLLEALAIARQIADVLSYCHDMGVVHFDLKPQNVMVTHPETLRIKVLDFGVSRIRGGWDERDALIHAGTPGFAAPEYLRAERGSSPDGRADLYSLGVLLFRMLAGRLPFRARSPRRHDRTDALIEAQLDGDVLPLDELLPSAPAGVVELLRGLLEVDPARRVQSAAWLAHELAALYYGVLGGPGHEHRPKLPRLVAADPVPLVGRDEPLRALIERVGDSRRRSATSAMLLEGEPGIGKSRLVSELLENPRVATGSFVAYGRCQEVGGLVAYAPLRSALARLARAVRGSTRDAVQPLREACRPIFEVEGELLGELAPELVECLCPDVGVVRRAPEPPTALGARRAALALAPILRAFARCAPVLVVIEDLHWADRSTLEVLEALVGQDLGPVFFLFTRRSGAEGEGLAGAERLVLGPLSAEANDTLLSLLTHGDPHLVSRLKSAVPLLAAGVPLFHRHVLAHLESHGYLARHDDGALVPTRSLDGFEPPDSVASILALTLARLPAEILEPLATAALLDRQFAVADLLGIASCSEDELRASLCAGERLGLCSIDGDVGLFAHDTVREALAARVPPERSAEVHGRIAAHLRQRGAPMGTRAHHLAKAGKPIEAARAHIEAGLEAERLGDLHGARAEFERALSLLMSRGEGTDDEHALVLTALLHCREDDLLSHHSGALEHLDRRRSDEGDGLSASMLYSYARLHYLRGEFVRAAEYGRACLGQGRPADRMASTHAPAVMLGRALCAAGSFEAAIELLAHHAQVAEAAGDLAEAAQARGSLGVALSFRGAFAQAQAEVLRSLGLARVSNDPTSLLGAHFYRAAAAEASGDGHTGRRAAAELLATAERLQLGEGLLPFLGSMFAGRHSYRTGNLPRARFLLGNTLQLAKRHDISYGLGWALAFYGDTLLAQEHVDDAHEAYQRGRELGEASSGDHFASTLCAIGLADCASRAGADPAEVLALGDAAIARLEQACDHANRAQALLRYAEVLERIGADERAAGRRRERDTLLDALGLRHHRWDVPGAGFADAARPVVRSREDG